MLDPTEAGWLAKYIEIRSTLPFSEKVNMIEGKEEKLYAHLHIAVFCTVTQSSFHWS
jgi:hypothetical protein